jgi:hypothetical protein
MRGQGELNNHEILTEHLQTPSFQEGAGGGDWSRGFQEREGGGDWSRGFQERAGRGD